MANCDTNFTDIYILGTFKMEDGNDYAITQSRALSLVSNYIGELSKTVTIVEVSISIANSQLRFEIKGFIQSGASIARSIVSTYVSKIGINLVLETENNYPELYFTIRNRSPPGYLII